MGAAECQGLCRAADCQESDSLKGDTNATLSKEVLFFFFLLPNLPDKQLISIAMNVRYAWVDATSSSVNWNLLCGSKTKSLWWDHSALLHTKTVHIVKSIQKLELLLVWKTRTQKSRGDYSIATDSPPRVHTEFTLSPPSSSDRRRETHTFISQHNCHLKRCMFRCLSNSTWLPHPVATCSTSRSFNHDIKVHCWLKMEET